MQKKDQKLNQKNWEQAVAACSCILVYFSQQNELIEFIDYKMTGMDPVYDFVLFSAHVQQLYVAGWTVLQALESTLFQSISIYFYCFVLTSGLSAGASEDQEQAARAEGEPDEKADAPEAGWLEQG